jgi:hypothetical protein
MIITILLTGETSRLPHWQILKRRTAMTKQREAFTKYHRYELVHGDDADFIAYQRRLGNGVWQTFSTWMIPHTACN